MDIIRRRYNISIYLSIYLSQLGVKRLNKYIFYCTITVTVTLKLPDFLWLAACSWLAFCYLLNP